MPKILNGTQNVLDILNAGGLFDQLNAYVGKEELGDEDTLSKLVKSKANQTDVDEISKQVNTNTGDIKIINESYVQKHEISSVATTGRYDDLLNPPIVRGMVSDYSFKQASYEKDENRVISEYDIAFGNNNISGCKGYYIKAIDIGRNKIYLSSATKKSWNVDIIKKGDSEYSNPTDKEFTNDVEYTVDNYFSVIVTDKILNGKNNKNHYHLCAKIIKIEKNVISYSEVIPFGDFVLQNTNDSANDQRTSLFFVPSQPEVGNVEISYGSYSEGAENKSGGRYSHAEGRGNIAAGDYSHVEGRSTSAGYAAHAEGESTKALGYSAHAEGQGGEAKGCRAHVEGLFTHAPGENSHAEGQNTWAYGLDSHAEGHESKARGEYSHAEGDQTEASGKNSHTEGFKTKATYISSHAEGYETEATNSHTHAEGKNSKATGYAAHAEGEWTVASGNESHAEGYHTQAIGTDSHAEGHRTQAIGENSHAEGFETQSRGFFSHTEGDNTKAYGVASHAEGVNTEAYDDGAHAEGRYTVASGYGAHAEGWNVEAKGYGSHAEGYGTKTIRMAQHVEGSYNIVDEEGMGSGYSGEYIHIAGNGSDNENRSNAYTLDWKGNAWYGGSIEVSEVIIRSSTKGSNKKFKLTIDDTGSISVTEV